MPIAQNIQAQFFMDYNYKITWSIIKQNIKIVFENDNFFIIIF